MRTEVKRPLRGLARVGNAVGRTVRGHLRGVVCNMPFLGVSETSKISSILHTQNPSCVCEISVIFFGFRYTLGLPQAPAWPGILTMYKQAEAEQSNAKTRDCG